ncbi:hypothetical protein GCM10009124_24530 [Shewanella xiamenensis]|nr:hypothetical protein GCM10009124_24530 [Shewanella xiamenensis]
MGTVTTSVSTPGSWLSGNAVGLTGLEFIETPIVKFCPTFIAVTLNHVLAKVMPFRNLQITTINLVINYPFG